MDCDFCLPGFTMGPGALGQLMPMYLHLDSHCRILSAGPTLLKLMGSGVIGTPLEGVFALRRPAQARRARDLVQAARLRMNLVRVPGTGFKGVAVPLRGGEEVLVNLSFGYAVREAVRDHALSDTDFAPTDLVIELLYLAEAKSAVMGELEQMNVRLRSAMQRAEEQALTDALTGLRNRRAMARQLDLTLAAGNPFALLHLDLDYFKAVNDTLGHGAGDHVLTEVGKILSAAVRDGDLVTRVGGDEFIILLPGIADPAPVRQLGARIAESVKQPIMFDGRPCHIAASIGAVLSCEYRRPDAYRLLSDADHALYAAKRAGRGRMVVRRAGDTSSAAGRDATLPQRA